MTRPRASGLVQSVLARLKNEAQKRDRPFAELLELYARERFLHRLGSSSHREHLILKGGVLLRHWLGADTRPTRDIDFLAPTALDADGMQELLGDLLQVEVEEDGLDFDLGSIVMTPIRADSTTLGLRAKFGVLGVEVLNLGVEWMRENCRTAALIALSLTLASDIEALQRGPAKPLGSFDPTTASSAPDYTRQVAWAALPSLEDSADLAPRGATDRQSTAEVDVFFVHPTTYLLGTQWNAALGDTRIDERTDVTAIRNQASVFNGAGRVYAPRYRQAILYAYLHGDRDSLKARDLAYEDVARAFDTYLERYSSGRPFILAGHSQGAYHLLRLLEERLTGPALRQRLVAAYLVGVPMPADKLERTLAGIPLCDSARSTGCLVSWNTVASWADRSRFSNTVHHYPEGTESNVGKALVCSNPLSWRNPEESATASGPLRAVAVSHRGPLRRAPGPSSAHCVDGLLEIDDPRGPSFRLTRGRKGDYHAYDLPLFHLDVRDNARLRAETFLLDR